MVVSLRVLAPSPPFRGRVENGQPRASASLPLLRRHFCPRIWNWLAALLREMRTNVCRCESRGRENDEERAGRARWKKDEEKPGGFARTRYFRPWYASIFVRRFARATRTPLPIPKVPTLRVVSVFFSPPPMPAYFSISIRFQPSFCDITASPDNVSMHVLCAPIGISQEVAFLQVNIRGRFVLAKREAKFTLPRAVNRGEISLFAITFLLTNDATSAYNRGSSNINTITVAGRPQHRRINREMYSKFPSGRP